MPHLEWLLLMVHLGLRVPDFFGFCRLSLCRQSEYFMINWAKLLDSLSSSPLLEALVLCNVTLLTEASGEEQLLSFLNLHCIVLSNCADVSISAFFSKSEIHPVVKISITFSRPSLEDRYRQRCLRFRKISAIAIRSFTTPYQATIEITRVTVGALSFCSNWPSGEHNYSEHLLSVMAGDIANLSHIVEALVDHHQMWQHQWLYTLEYITSNITKLMFMGGPVFCLLDTYISCHSSPIYHLPHLCVLHFDLSNTSVKMRLCLALLNNVLAAWA